MLWILGFGLGLAWFAGLKVGFDRLIDGRMSRLEKRVFRALLMGSFVGLGILLAAVMAELVAAGHWPVAAVMLIGLSWLWHRRLRHARELSRDYRQ